MRTSERATEGNVGAMGDRPLRVLMTADAVGGVWSYVLDLCAGLSARGVRVALATMGPRPSEEQRGQAERIPGLTLHEGDYALEWEENAWEGPRSVAEANAWLLALEAEMQPDVVHLNGYAHGSLGWKAPKLVVAHSCVFSWWRAVRHEEPPASYERYRNAVAQGLHAADVRVAPTHAMASTLSDHYGRVGPVEVIGNATRFLFRRTARGLPEKEPFVLTAGRLWDQAKNLQALDGAAPRLPWPVYAAGSNASPGGHTLLPRAVHMLGSLDREQVQEWMGRAAVYALPARYEPFGLSVLEAALCGCALVLGDIPSLRELWGDAALFVPPDDQDALRYALRSLVDAPTLRTELARRARVRATTFEHAGFVKSYVNLYDDLIAKRPRAARSAEQCA